MTAEVAILNKMGVAMAADSAVSIGGSGKVYNSANKLFALSKKHPVGIMIYGNAHFMSVPWEIIIKYYRSNELKESSFPTIQDYAESFLKFLSQTPILPKEDESNYVNYYAYRVSNDVQKLVSDGMENYFRVHKISTKRTIVVREMRKLVTDWITKENKKTRQYLPLTKKNKDALVKTHGTNVTKLLEDFFQNQLILPLFKTTHQALSKIVFERLFSTETFSSPSGLVIAGFGDNQIFPSCYQVSIEGRLSSVSKLKVSQPKIQKIGTDNNSSIAPFAQREMVDTFMCGIDPQYKKAIYDNLKTQLNTLGKEILPNLGVTLSPQQISELDTELTKRSEALLKACAEVEQKHFVRPVLSSVAALPLDELAAMAEALVNLTSFKRRVTIVPESVGGPIDVAVISRGDGFIWINRKHYFKPDLNHHFFER